VLQLTHCVIVNIAWIAAGGETCPLARRLGLVICSISIQCKAWYILSRSNRCLFSNFDCNYRLRYDGSRPGCNPHRCM